MLTLYDLSDVYTYLVTIKQGSITVLRRTEIGIGKDIELCI